MFSELEPPTNRFNQCRHRQISDFVRGNSRKRKFGNYVQLHKRELCDILFRCVFLSRHTLKGKIKIMSRSTCENKIESE